MRRKHDGWPRRTVELSQLNKHCKRGPSLKIPIQPCPVGFLKVDKDCLQCLILLSLIPLRGEEKHLTTFVTPWGMFRYRRTLQGFVSSGDKFNLRFDDLSSPIVRMERCVHDNLLHDTETTDHWWRVIDLDLVGVSDVICNFEKFQFSQPEADFAGFCLTESSVEPLPKYLRCN